VKAEAKGAGVSERTFDRAKRKRGDVARKEGGHFSSGKQRGMWALPDDEPGADRK